MITHDLLMSDLAEKHGPLADLLNGRQLHYLDLPFYTNVGDLLIMLGTLRFFERARLHVSRMGMYFNYDPAWASSGETIVFQGGGNFGDLYGPFQRFRERVVAALPRNRIVILPQSIHFVEESNFRKCCELYSRHPDLHICVRDERSHVLAQKMTPNVYLMPDMAHQLWPLAAERKKPSNGTLFLHRRDGEVGTAAFDAGQSWDWEDMVGKKWIFFLSQIAERCMTHAQRLGINKAFSKHEAQWWIGQAQRFVDQAVAHFSKFERIESDRLHAHILACLMGLPNTIHDNSYGKNSNYIRLWTKDSPLVRVVQEPAPAKSGRKSA